MRDIVRWVMRLAGIYTIYDKMYQNNKYSGSDSDFDENKQIYENMKTFLTKHDAIQEELRK